jgi:rare lipoprotein A
MPKKFPKPATAALCALLLGGCASLEEMMPVTGPDGREVKHVYVTQPSFVETGIASWYGGRWIGRLTANGETYQQGDMTAAHKRLPFHTHVRVVDLKTGNSVVVRINNRGPFIKGRIIDLSVAAAQKLGTYDRGIAKVRIEALREVPVLSKPNRKLPPRPKPSPTPPPAKAENAHPKKRWFGLF